MPFTLFPYPPYIDQTVYPPYKRSQRFGGPQLRGLRLSQIVLTRVEQDSPDRYLKKQPIDFHCSQT